MDEQELLNDSIETRGCNYEFVAKNRHMKILDWLLMKVKSGKQHSTIYSYLFQTLSNYDTEDEWFQVLGYRSVDITRSKFQKKENDIFGWKLDVLFFLECQAPARG